MIKGLSEYEKYRVVRPVIGGCELDDQYMRLSAKLWRTPLTGTSWHYRIQEPGQKA